MTWPCVPVVSRIKHGLLVGLLVALQPGVCSAEPSPQEPDLKTWRAESERLWIEVSNDAPLAYRRAQWLQAHVPADATAVDQARLLNVLARAEINLARDEEGMHHAREARDLAEKNRDSVEQVKADINLSVGAVFLSDLKVLTEAAVHGMTAAGGLNRTDLLVEMMMRASLVYGRLGQVERSVTICMQAMDIAKSSMLPLAQVYAHQCLAISYDHAGRSEETRHHYSEMRRWAAAAPSRILEGTALIGMATEVAAGTKEGAKEAEPLIRNALGLFRAAGAYHMVDHALSRLAENLRFQGRHQDSLVLMDEVVAHYEKGKVKIPLWWALTLRSAQHKLLGRPKDELADAEQAYTLAQDIGLPTLRSQSAKLLADIYARHGNSARAYPLSREALDLVNQAAQVDISSRMDTLAERYQSESKQKQINELTRRDQEHSMQLRWLATVMGSAVALLMLTTYFLLRLRRSQGELRHQTEILQSILDNMGDGVVLTDDHGHVLMANPMAANMLGIEVPPSTAAAVPTMPKGFRLYLPGADDATRRTELSLTRVLTERSSDGLEIFVDDPDNPAGRWVSKTVRPITGKGNAGRILVSVFSDVSAHRQALELTKKNEREFRILAETSLDVIVRYDRECRRIYLNPSFDRVTGLRSDQLLGTRIAADEWRACINFSASDYNAILQRVMASGVSDEVILEWRKPDGNLTTHVLSVVPERMGGKDVTGVLTIARDITALKEAEQRQAEAYAMLREVAARRETAREEERGRIARELHDELGQVITALRLGISSLRISFGADNPALAERVASLVQLVDKALQSVRDVATLLRPPALDMGIVAALDWLAKEFSQHTGINCNLTVPREAVELDRNRSSTLFRLVQESLTNVVRHAQATRVDITIEADDEGYVLQVQDDGVGFDPSQVGKRSYGLLGMRERSTLLGGTVHIDSAPGKGTCIRVQLPFSPKQVAA